MSSIQIKPASPRLCCKRVNFILCGPLEVTGGSARREAQICLKCVVFFNLQEDHINQMQWKQSDLQ